MSKLFVEIPNVDGAESGERLLYCTSTRTLFWKGAGISTVFSNVILLKVFGESNPKNAGKFVVQHEFGCVKLYENRGKGHSDEVRFIAEIPTDGDAKVGHFGAAIVSNKGEIKLVRSEFPHIPRKVPKGYTVREKSGHVFVHNPTHGYWGINSAGEWVSGKTVEVRDGEVFLGTKSLGRAIQ